MLNKNLLGSSGIANWIKLYTNDTEMGSIRKTKYYITNNTVFSPNFPDGEPDPLEGKGIFIAPDKSFVYPAESTQYSNEVSEYIYINYLLRYWGLSENKKYKYKLASTVFNEITIKTAKYYDESGFQTLRQKIGEGYNLCFSDSLATKPIYLWVGYDDSIFKKYTIGDIFYTVWEGRDHLEIYITNPYNSPSLTGKTLYIGLQLANSLTGERTKLDKEIALEGWAGRQSSVCFSIDLRTIDKAFAEKLRGMFRNFGNSFLLRMSLSTQPLDKREKPKPNPSTAPSAGSSDSSTTGSHEGETAWEVSLFNPTDSDDGLANPTLIADLLKIVQFDIKSSNGDLLVHIPQPDVRYKANHKLTVYSKEKPKVTLIDKGSNSSEILDLDGIFPRISLPVSGFITIKEKESNIPWSKYVLTLHNSSDKWGTYRGVWGNTGITLIAPNGDEHPVNEFYIFYKGNQNYGNIKNKDYSYIKFSETSEQYVCDIKIPAYGVQYVCDTPYVGNKNYLCQTDGRVFDNVPADTPMDVYFRLRKA